MGSPRLCYRAAASCKRRSALACASSSPPSPAAPGRTGGSPKHAGLIQRTTIAVFDALCSLAKKHGRVFPSHKGIARLAKCSKNTVIPALRRLAFFGFVTVHRRVRRYSAALGQRTVQDTNAYSLHEPNAWGEKALTIFASPDFAPSPISGQLDLQLFSRKRSERENDASRWQFERKERFSGG